MCFRAQRTGRARACIKKLLVLKHLRVKIQIVTLEERKYIQIKTIWLV